MDLRQLRYFVAVAEDLHFGRAADRLGITQPTLSDHIRRLENDLGTVLLDRSSRHVGLSPTGQILLDGARQVLARVDDLEHVVRSAADGRAGYLRIGAVGPAVPAMLANLVRTLRRASPDLDLRIESMSSSRQVEGVLSGTLDVALARHVPARRGLRIDKMLDEHFVSVLPAHHQLAARTSIRAAELDRQPFVFWKRAGNPRLFDSIFADLRDRRCEPGSIIEANEVHAQLALIAAGVGVSVQPASYADIIHPGVTCVPLDEPDLTTELQIVSSNARPTPVTQRFIAAALDYGRKHRDKR